MVLFNASRAIDISRAQPHGSRLFSVPYPTIPTSVTNVAELETMYLFIFTVLCMLISVQSAPYNGCLVFVQQSDQILEVIHIVTRTLAQEVQ
jgi:hypothetical protein